MIYLDTHCVAWLYAGLLDRFTPDGLELLEYEELLISPMVVLELEYLYEIGRVKVCAADIIEYLVTVINLEVCKRPFYQVVLESLHLNWTRDPFDRMIVAQSIASDAKLMTKDQMIADHYPNVVW